MAGTATAAKAGSGTVDDTGIDLLSGTGVGCTAIEIWCRPSSENNLLVNVPSLHGTDWVQWEPGLNAVFRKSGTGIAAANVKALNSSAVATVSWAVVAQI